MESKLNYRILFKIECKSVNCHPISCLSTETYCEEWPRKAAGLWKPQVLSVRPGYQDEAALEICDDEELVITRLWLGQGGSLWRQRCGLHRPGIPGSSLSLSGPGWALSGRKLRQNHGARLGSRAACAACAACCDQPRARAAKVSLLPSRYAFSELDRIIDTCRAG